MSDQYQDRIDGYEEENFEEEIYSGEPDSRKPSYQEQEKQIYDQQQQNQQTFQSQEVKDNLPKKAVQLPENQNELEDYNNLAYSNQQQQSQPINPLPETSSEVPGDQYFQREDNRPKTHHTHQRPHFTEVNQAPIPVQDNLINAESSPFANANQFNQNQKRYQSNNARPTTHGASGHSHSNFQNATFEEFKQVALNNTSQVKHSHPQSNQGFRKTSQQPQRNYQSYDKDQGRRQFIAQMLNQQQNSSLDNQQPSKQYHVLNFNNAISKRKKIKELIYGQSVKNSLLQQKEKEELLQEKRFLKIQQNTTNDENIKLKTKIQQLQNELGKRDKDIEQLVIQYQHLQQTQKGQVAQVDNHVYESFLVSQLKRTNRELRFEVSEKDKIIDGLKKDQKLTKNFELETELQVYIQECGRLRGLLEQAFFERQQFMQSQNQEDQYTQQQYANVQKLEEAYFEKENQYQMEREARNQLQMNYMQVKEQFDKAAEKAKLAEGRVKKMNELQSQTKRQEIMLRQKNKELVEYKSQIEALKVKANERDNVYNKNKELVTKQYALQSNIEAKEKQIQALKKENEKMQEESRGNIKQLHTNPSPARSVSTPQKIISSLPPKSINKYNNENFFIYLQRSFNNQQTLSVNDKLPYKNYISNHKSDLDKEVDHLKKLKISKETKQSLSQKQDIIVSNLSRTFTYQQIDKLLEDQLQISDKDQRKYIFVHFILKLSQVYEHFNLSQLLTEIKSPSFIEAQEEIDTVRVNDSVGETTGQFMPPSNFNNTPVQPDDFKSSTLNEKKEASETKSKPLQNQMQEVDEYEEEQFEQSEKVSQQFDFNKNRRSLGEDEQEEQKQLSKESKAPPEPEQKKEEDDEDGYDEDNFDPPQDEGQEQKQNLEIQNQQQQREQEEDEGDDGEDGGPGEQISEEQMLDIAETVFEMIGTRLKQLNITVFKAFGQFAQIVEEFEGRENVEILGAREFLDGLEQLQINDISQIQIACLMQVLSRPELEHAIILHELQMVLNNFGVPEEEESIQQESKEQLVNKKQKQNKKKLIQNLLKNDKSPVYAELANVMKICEYNIDILSDIIQDKCYEQLVKQKTKEVRLILIKRDDFFSEIKDKTGVQISSETQEELSPILQLDAKYADILQLKLVSTLFQETMARIKKEEEEQQKLQEFYSPQKEEENPVGGGGGEVMNFEQMMENYEDDYEREELNAIQEDQREESASPARSQLKGGSIDD